MPIKTNTNLHFQTKEDIREKFHSSQILNIRSLNFPDIDSNHSMLLGKTKNKI